MRPACSFSLVCSAAKTRCVRDERGEREKEGGRGGQFATGAVFARGIMRSRERSIPTIARRAIFLRIGIFPMTFLSPRPECTLLLLLFFVGLSYISNVCI